MLVGSILDLATGANGKGNKYADVKLTDDQISVYRQLQGQFGDEKALEYFKTFSDEAKEVLKHLAANP